MHAGVTHEELIAERAKIEQALDLRAKGHRALDRLFDRYLLGEPIGISETQVWFNGDHIHDQLMLTIDTDLHW